MAKSAYLLVYNLFCCSVWAWLLFQAITVESDQLWHAIELQLKAIQTLAILEVFHALVGLVRSPVPTTVIQVAVRLFCVWAVVNISASARIHWGFRLMIASWGLVEVPRYLFYALNLLDRVPSWLFFLRYHFFMILYPSGFVAEIACMTMALQDLQATDQMRIALPNALNLSISLSTIIYLVLILYLPGLPIQYSHMLRQRSKAYAKVKKC